MTASLGTRDLDVAARTGRAATSTRRSGHCAAVALLALGLGGALATADTWPGWRGVDREGRSTSSDSPLTWSLDHNVAWCVESPGEGYSSPIVTEEAVYLTAAVDAPGHRSAAAPYRWVVWLLTVLVATVAALAVGVWCAAAAASSDGYARRPPLVTFGALVLCACWLALFAENLVGFSQGPEREWVAAGVVGTLALVASAVAARAAGRLVSAILLVVLGAALQTTVPHGLDAYGDGPFSPKSLFHHSVVATPLVAGLLVLLWRGGQRAPRPAASSPTSLPRPRPSGWRWIALLLPVLLLGAVVVLVLGQQRRVSLTVGAATYEPSVPLWLVGALGAAALAGLAWRRRRPSHVAAHVLYFVAGVAFWAVGVAAGLERVLAASPYLSYQLGDLEIRPLPGWGAVWVLGGLAGLGLLVSAGLGSRFTVRTPGLRWTFQPLTGVLAAVYFIYAVYAPKHPELLYRIVSLDRQTGKVNWLSRGVTGRRGYMNAENAPATPTPVCDGERVYAWYGTPGLTCVDTGGKTQWVNREFAYEAQEGVASSLVLCDGSVIVLCESELGGVLGAVDCRTGDAAWRVERGKRIHAYAGNCRTPSVKTVAGRKTIIVWGYTDISGYDPRTGRELWTHDIGHFGPMNNPVASIVSDGERLYLVGPEKILALEVDGLVGSETPVAWELARSTGAQSASPVLSEGLLFLVSDQGIAYCIDAATGRVLWEESLHWRHYASPVAVGDRIYFTSRSGRTTVVRAGAQYEQLAVSDLDEVVQASIAPVDGQLFLRTETRLYCLEEGAGGVPQALRAGAPSGKRTPAGPGVGETTWPEGPAATALPAGPDWPRFRGPTGSGLSGHEDVPTAWDGATGESILWRTPIPLPGNSSPVVWGDRIFCTGADPDAQAVYCLDADTGDVLWTGDVPAGAPMPEVNDMTGYAAPTPTADGQHVCALFANGMLVCFDHEGKQVWDEDLGVPDNPYGLASSPVIFEDVVIVQYDQGTEDDDQSLLFALDIGSGEERWRAPRGTAASWATPLVVGADKRQELITCAQPWVIAHDPATGRELWRAGCIGGDVAPSPILAGGLAFTVSDRSCLAAIRPGGTGDVTNRHVAWTAEDDLPDICSPVSDGELVFTLTTYGMLTCRQATDGEVVWQQELDATFQASPSIVNGKLYVTSSEEGETFVIAVGRTFEELGRAVLGEPVSASLAFGPGRIYMRGRRDLYCIGQ